MPDYREVAEAAVRAAGAALLDWRGRFHVRQKGPCDPVTEADLAAQEAAWAVLSKAFPSHDLLSEESPHDRLADERFRWILDPLDGTQNYVHGLPLYTVSLALERAGKLLVGCVYNPVSDECFLAESGGAATLNGLPIRCSGVEQIGSALVAISLPPLISRESPELQQLIEVSTRAQAIRRLGSSALNLALVAAGRLDAFFATETHIWDIAGGVALVEAAGGTVIDPSGGPVDLKKPRVVAASTAALARQLASLLQG
ncbi:MAG: inositol monophosphatase [Pirellulales bacterium]|nr:inositol monophosphatase [Pirellulales bacterium]